MGSDLQACSSRPKSTRIGYVRDLSRPRPSLRERNKQRAREAIVQAATDLFSERGYAATTLAEIAAEAGVAPSTLHNYYPAKSDIVFSLLNEAIASAECRIVGRPEHESASVAIVAWLKEDLPELEVPYTNSLRRMPRIVDTDAELQHENRLRMALLEDVFATAFARDLGEPPKHMRPHVMATIALRGILDAWEAWDLQQDGDAVADLEEISELKSSYLERVLAAGMEAIETLATLEYPTPS
jgi:AcrR family transcriptional regulator